MASSVQRLTEQYFGSQRNRRLEDMHCTIELKRGDSVRGVSLSWVSFTKRNCGLKMSKLNSSTGHRQINQTKTTQNFISECRVGGRAVTGNAIAVKIWLLVLVTHIFAL